MLRDRLWYRRSADGRTVGINVCSTVCMGLQWPMQFGYYPAYYDGPHKCLHLGVLWFQYSAWGLP